MSIPNEQFGALFKKYRLRSEIETLSEFGNLLAQEGLVYETSLFTRWQNGQRVPKKRDTLLKIIAVFGKRGGVRSEEEINALLATVNQRSLNIKESLQFERYMKSTVSDTLPDPIGTFVGREQVTKDVGWDLLQKKSVLIHGVPGVGKTALAIQVAHQIRDSFYDGIFWFRADIKSSDGMVDEVLSAFHIDPKEFMQLEQKLERLSRLVSGKKILIILDNIEKKHMVSPFITFLFEEAIPALMTSIEEVESASLHRYILSSFTQHEFFACAETILGKPYVEVFHEQLVKLGYIVGYLPILTTLILKQIGEDPHNIQSLICQMEYQKMGLDKALYDNKNLHASLNFAFSRVSQYEQKLLIASSVFEAADFSIHALAQAAGIAQARTREIVQHMIQYALIEPSGGYRYRLHPAVRMYLRGKLDTRAVCKRLTRFYTRLIEKQGSNGEKLFQKEVENIMGVMQMCYQEKMYHEFVTLWEAIREKLWLYGWWGMIEELKEQLEKAYTVLERPLDLADYYSEHLSRILFYLGRVEEAIIFLNKPLEIVKKEKDLYREGGIKQKFGFVSLLTLKQYREAIRYLSESIKLMKESGVKTEVVFNGVMKSRVYLGKAYTDAKQYESALKEFEIVIENKDHHDELGLAYVFLGSYYFDLKDYKKAEKTYLEALTLERGLKRKISIAMCLASLGTLYKTLGKVKKAKQHIQDALELYRQLNIRREVERLEGEVQGGAKKNV